MPRCWNNSPALMILLLPSFVIEIVSFRPYSTYRFSPNGVCTSPRHFEVNDAETFVMRSVPGEGDCMFLAVALATLTSMGLGGNDAILRAISRETRDVVATVLEAPSGHLVIEGKRLVSAPALLRSAAKEEGLSTEEYLIQLRKEGIEGGLYGGGPELTVLANVLRRPISIYEIDHVKAEESQQEDVAHIQRMGVFGRDFFQDPLEALPESAILTHPYVHKGAYSWHLHILVVDTSPAVILAFRDLATRLPQNEPVPETVVKTILFIRTVQKLNDSLTFREKQQRRAHRDEMAISFRQKQQIEHNNIVEVP